ncbi:hypothetical protein KFE25_008130 [Diacronema lutheri]|uniref:Pru domain-containing protein n=1 Tax=Diacronema lutheri TaxID=2081491 RepID=A0A8J5XDL2_DIALT|nr:hypothetical protein KFE25_008130 [Diacronema lutheri]
MLFSSAARAGPRPLVQFKAGKMALSGTTLAPEKRKGELAIHQSEDGLMHVTWTDLAASAPEDDLIVFPQEVSLKRIAQCKDAYAMVLGWTTSSRKIFFWSQELRKKGAAADDFAAEDALVAKFNSTVDNPPTPGSGGGGGGGGGGTIGGLSQSNYNELMAMLQRNAGATRVEPAPAPTPAPTPASSAPTPSATPSVAPTAATPAAPMAERTHAASATPAAAAPITSEGLQAILRGVMQRSHTAQQDGALLPELFSREELLDVVRRNYNEFQALLRPHLAPTQPADSVEETLTSPQLRQAVGQLAAALNSPNAEQIFAELNLRPANAGVLGFIEAVQQQADSAGGASAPASDHMDTS